MPHKEEQKFFLSFLSHTHSQPAMLAKHPSKIEKLEWTISTKSAFFPFNLLPECICLILLAILRVR